MLPCRHPELALPCNAGGVSFSLKWQIGLLANVDPHSAANAHMQGDSEYLLSHTKPAALIKSVGGLDHLLAARSLLQDTVGQIASRCLGRLLHHICKH